MSVTKLVPPSTYSEWVDILNMFKEKENDEEVLEAMQGGTIQWQSGVAERFARKLIDAVNHRMNVATDRFQREMSRACGQEGAIVRALLALRKELVFLSKAINLPALPEKDREHYYQLVIEQANNIQKSLEESAQKDRSGKMSSIVRNNRINAF